MATRKRTSPRDIAIEAANAAVEAYAQSPQRVETLRNIVRESVTEVIPQAINTALDRLGINTQDPDIARRNFIFLHNARLKVEAASSLVWGTVLKAVVMVGMGALGAGLVVMLTRTP